MIEGKALKKAAFEAETERQAALLKGKSHRQVFEHAQRMIDVWRRIGLDALARNVGGPLDFEPVDDAVLEAANRAIERAIDACAEMCRRYVEYVKERHEHVDHSDSWSNGHSKGLREAAEECAERIAKRSIFKEQAALGDLEIAKAKLAGLVP